MSDCLGEGTLCGGQSVLGQGFGTDQIRLG
jgi:hypothetical protein